MESYIVAQDNEAGYERNLAKRRRQVVEYNNSMLGMWLTYAYPASPSCPVIRQSSILINNLISTTITFYRKNQTCLSLHPNLIIKYTCLILVLSST